MGIRYLHKINYLEYASVKLFTMFAGYVCFLIYVLIFEIKVQASDVENKTVGLYFLKKSHQSCNYFHSFLLRAYNRLIEFKCKFKVVLMTLDQSAIQDGEELAEMPWLSMPFKEESINNA